MVMFDISSLDHRFILPYPKHVTISFYEKKRGMHQRIDKKLTRFGIEVLGSEYFYYPNNPAFDVHIKCRLCYICAN